MNEQTFTIIANDRMESIERLLDIILKAPTNEQAYDETVDVLKDIEKYVSLKMDEVLPQ